ncbi:MULTISPECIES: UDP-N-acetylglucosamine--undecaprenyl-phosphate N-acetylglucosaminephosphotransferase [unclassified Arsukibacterium]|uniref:UDP-N-acetylglucosamine--undecaprenyl-phosphate N-acetylglucosaminephosphotransferase n=1 Tax=unclassified Arsukibacterium TaxID=2635278 RepID=UPI000C92F829|nr:MULTISPECIES: UDP-N-acetylglucosamine--undecaprenyl-phosphate N-acetylglucosaminephosphotransferase [unclassified Arsukibacterium]MAA93226.1 undecaprenyl-phosphate alpha-N-acetylglucosaminyl 1-phosphate transferase [Rheinheimera sp.]HAW92701.1 undecaprenyl-phosphate alpha-N-acetylglucosaminyl 1-phosphate transferase [Candidatus Azambacteria bacterium]
MPIPESTYSLILAVITSLLAILLLRPLAPKLCLLDIPHGRKQHVGAVPLIGGLAIYLTLMLVLGAQVSSDIMLGYYLACATVIVILGAFDDALDLSVKLRLAIQLVVGLAMIYSLDLHINNLGNIFGFGEVKLGFFGIPFTLIAVIAAINAFNMTDGIDGLAGLLSMVSFTSIAVFMVLWGQPAQAILPLVFIAALLPYLAFNLGWVKHKKIFMGDAGSMLIGLSVIWLLLISTQSETASFRPVTALWLIAVPLMDMVAIMLRRILKGQSPFQADREHLHHISLRLGLNPRESLVLITALAWVFACIGIIGEYLLVPEVAMLALFTLVFTLYIGLLQNIWRIISAIRHNLANRR